MKRTRKRKDSGWEMAETQDMMRNKLPGTYEDGGSAVRMGELTRVGLVDTLLWGPDIPAGSIATSRQIRHITLAGFRVIS